MTDIQIFSNPQFGEIRITISEDDKPMFCLADVCKALELKNPSDVKTRLSSKGVAITDTLTAGGVQSMTYINEANLYKCIFQSRKPEAEKFQNGNHRGEDSIDIVINNVSEYDTDLMPSEDTVVISLSNKDALKLIRQLAILIGKNVDEDFARAFPGIAPF